MTRKLSVINSNKTKGKKKKESMPNLKLNEKNGDEGDGGVWSKIIPSERERAFNVGGKTWRQGCNRSHLVAIRC